MLTCIVSVLSHSIICNFSDRGPGLSFVCSEGKAQLGGAIRALKTCSKLECGFKCLAGENCNGFNFENENCVCALHTQIFLSFVESTVSSKLCELA